MRFLNLTKLATLVLAVSLMGISIQALAQQRPEQQPQPPQQPAAGMQQSQSFSGTITKSGSNFVLKDEATKTSYTLDNAEEAKQYVGKNVRVTGSLDPSTNMIHVEKIELVAQSPGDN